MFTSKCIVVLVILITLNSIFNIVFTKFTVMILISYMDDEPTQGAAYLPRQIGTIRPQ